MLFVYILVSMSLFSETGQDLFIPPGSERRRVVSPEFAFCGVDRGLPEQLVVMNPENFDGSSSVREYLQRFHLAANNNCWGPETKAAQLLYRLKGRAHDVIFGQFGEVSPTYSQIAEELTREFGGKREHRLAVLYRWETLKLGRGEEISDLRSNIRQMAAVLFCELGPEERERMCVDKFVCALDDPVLMRRLIDSNPSSMEEAYEIVLEEKRIMGVVAKKRRQSTPTDCRMVNGSDRQVSELAEQVQALTSRVEQMSEMLLEDRQRLEDRRVVKCYRCGREGHISKHCAQRDARACFRCRKRGHLARDCREPLQTDEAGQLDTSTTGPLNGEGTLREGDQASQTPDVRPSLKPNRPQ